MRRLFFSLVLLLLLISGAHAQELQHQVKLSVLDFGTSPLGKRAADKLRSGFRSASNIQLLDPDLSLSAARGVGYSGSLNMSVSEARDLGNAMDSEFFIIGDSQTIRRSSSKVVEYYESYSSILVISSRSGQLVFWDRLSAESDKPNVAEENLSKALSAKELIEQCLAAIEKAFVDEKNQRAIVLDAKAPLVEEAPEDDKAAEAQGFRLPRPFRRLRPVYPESAARAEIEATVDVLVDVSADGDVGQIQVVRWAGFGLDETTVATVRQLHFFPASRNGKAVPMRVLLRYNFRKPTQ
jgi:TonB family protein